MSSPNAPHQTYKASSITESPLFDEVLQHYDSLSNEINEASDLPLASPLYPRYDAAGDAFRAATDALYAVIDAHCALEAFKAVHRLTQEQEAKQAQQTPHRPNAPHRPAQAAQEALQAQQAQQAQQVSEAESLASFRADSGDDAVFQAALSKLCAAVARAVRNGALVIADVRPLDDSINAEWENVNRAAQSFAVRWLLKKQQMQAQETQTPQPPPPKRGRPPKGRAGEEPQE